MVKSCAVWISQSYAVEMKQTGLILFRSLSCRTAPRPRQTHRVDCSFFRVLPEHPVLTYSSDLIESINLSLIYLPHDLSFSRVKAVFSIPSQHELVVFCSKTVKRSRKLWLSDLYLKPDLEAHRNYSHTL